MSFALVLFYENANGSDLTVSAADLGALRAKVAQVPGLTKAMIFTPEKAQDLYLNDGSSPPLGVQMLFDRITDLEAACGPEGALQVLPSFLPSLSGCEANQQAFVHRTYPVDDATLRTEPGALPCSYVVSYAGPAQDMNAWLGHYIAGHPRIMRRFPGIRWIEILTRCDWVTHLPFKIATNMQRNRVMFDSPEALTAALQSPVRHEMRADFHTFPAFEGDNLHFPMATETVVPA
ncbi:MAG: hypothetical protein Q7J57_00045 [Gemmobacter sp.]|nr:hypothetical protein [Gemmobacter sp.]